MPADLQRARELFMHAVGHLPPERWDGYIAEACGTDVELEQQVKHFLEVHRKAGSFLEQPAAQLGGTYTFVPSPLLETLSETVGAVIGPYKLLARIFHRFDGSWNGAMAQGLVEKGVSTLPLHLARSLRDDTV